MDTLIRTGEDEASVLLGRGLEVFRHCLASCGDGVAGLSACGEASDGNALHANWRQANWELLVEGPLHDRFGMVLDVYDGEADVWDTSSRVLAPHASATHRVEFVVRPGAIEQVEYTPVTGGSRSFDGFVTMRDGWPSRLGTLTYVQSDADSGPEVYALVDVVFRVVPA
jgi:hypothetical protein